MLFKTLSILSIILSFFFLGYSIVGAGTAQMVQPTSKIDMERKSIAIKHKANDYSREK